MISCWFGSWRFMCLHQDVFQSFFLWRLLLFFLKKYSNPIFALTSAETTAEEGEHILLFLTFHVDSDYSFKDITIFVRCVGTAWIYVIYMCVYVCIYIHIYIPKIYLFFWEMNAEVEVSWSYSTLLLSLHACNFIGAI